MLRNSTFAALAGVALATSPAEARWITSWAAAPTPPGPALGPMPATPSFQDRTLRQTLRLSAGGQALRIRLTNAYGAAPLSVGGASIALLDANGNEMPGTRRQLRFSGAAAAVAAKGAPLLSDPVKLDLPPLSKVSLSVYLPGDTGPCTCHPAGLDTTDVSPPGDFTAKPFKAESTIQMRAFVAAAEVDAPDDARTLVVVGDSISDGVGSTLGANRRWPDFLAERLAKRGGTVWGVANQGISGNRVLGDGAGLSAMARLDQDVFAMPNVGAIILFEGVNDLGLSFGRFEGTPMAEAAKANPGWKIEAKGIIAAYRQIIDRAHANGIKVYGATIAPYKGAFYWSPEGDAARQEINRFIRTSGAFDAVIDFDEVVRDPADPASFRTGYHNGDFLHGSDAGYKAMAEAIDLKLFED